MRIFVCMIFSNVFILTGNSQQLDSFGKAILLSGLLIGAIFFMIEEQKKK